MLISPTDTAAARAGWDSQSGQSLSPGEGRGVVCSSAATAASN